MKKAFTFIELLIAVSLFTVGMLSVLQIFPANRKLLNQSAQTTQAAGLAEEQMENIQTVAYSDLTVGSYEPQERLSDSPSSVFYQFQRSTTVSLIDTSYATTNTDTGLKKVIVTVNWAQGAVNRQYTITTFVYNK